MSNTRKELARMSQKNNPDTVAGRITLSLGKELKQQTVRLARERGYSVSGLMRAFLTKWIKTGKI